MPLGAFRINSISRYVAAPLVAAIDEVFTSTNLEYTPQSFQFPKISYVGDDSSGQPVYFAGLRSPAGFTCSLFRRNNNGTISESAVTTLKADDELFSIQSASGLDTVGNPVGVVVGTYRVGGTNLETSTYATQINVDALTLGTPYSLDAWDNDSPSSGAGFAYVTYTGINGKFICGYRIQGMQAELQTVSATTITSATKNNIADVGGGVYQGIESFPDTAGTYRYAYAGSNAAVQGLGYYNSSEVWQGRDTDSILDQGIWRNQAFPVSPNTYITFQSKANLAKAVAGTVTWPTSGAPTQTMGTAYTMSSSASWNNSFGGAVDHTTDTLYIIGRDTIWGVWPLTVAGTTITEGTKLTVAPSTTNWNIGAESVASCFANSAQGNLLTSVIDDAASNKVFIYFKEIV